jgi:hypothetical protein
VGAHVGLEIEARAVGGGGRAGVERDGREAIEVGDRARVGVEALQRQAG